MAKIKPYGINILVKPVEIVQKLISSERSLCEYGEVLAVGDDVKSIKVGDKIGFIKWGVNALEIDNEKHYFVSEDSRFILGTIE